MDTQHSYIIGTVCAPSHFIRHAQISGSGWYALPHVQYIRARLVLSGVCDMWPGQKFSLVVEEVLHHEISKYDNYFPHAEHSV